MTRGKTYQHTATPHGDEAPCSTALQLHRMSRDRTTHHRYVDKTRAVKHGAVQCSAVQCCVVLSHPVTLLWYDGGVVRVISDIVLHLVLRHVQRRAAHSTGHITHPREH